MKKLAVLLAVLVLLAGCGETVKPPVLPAPVNFADDVKGIWVSYLELDAAFRNADPAAARAYIETVMETVKNDGFNTVFFHVRAYGDAYYASDIFPAAVSAAHLLKAGFDPLSVAVEAAHKRGLSLHAWVNPYRLGADASHAVCTDVYAWEETFYYIPTSLTVQRCILDGVRELVTKYAVDGVQFDDYFYPAGLPAEALPFETFPAGVSAADGRRAAVNTLVAGTFAAVHTRKDALFGISPTGNIDRNRDTLYADVARWTQYTGYVDYLCPQVYSGFLNETLPFDKQIAAFAALPRAKNVRLYAGLALYKTGDKDMFAGDGVDEWQKNSDILSRQITAAEDAGFAGVVLFRYDHWAESTNDIRKKEKQGVIETFS
ncbi:MAG: family 10 glycosylhydrolase [Clostridia bacterium]|nr:family 10 glycosylhydrolase [Clostridia bacterium]